MWREEEVGVTGSRPHSSSPTHLLPRAGQGRHGPVGEGEGRAGRPRPRPPRPLSRDEERAAPRPRDVERSRDVEARSSRTEGGTTGGVRLLGAQTQPTVSFPPVTTLPGLHHLRTFSPNPHPTPPRRQLLTFAFLHTALTDLFSQASPTQNPPTTSLKKKPSVSSLHSNTSSQ